MSGALSGAGPDASLGARSDGAHGASSGASSADAPTAHGANSTGPLRGSAYRLPPLDVLLPEDLKTEVNPDEIAQRGVQIVRTLSEFQIQAKLVGCERGPATTMYELSLGPGINVNRVLALANNLAMAVMSHDVRVIAPIPGRSTIGVEVPNLRTEIVRMRPLMASEDPAFVRATAIPLLLGRDTSGAPLVSDLTAMPHLLIAGTTGSGKSVCMDAVITSILMLRRPDQVKLLLIDPKMVELSRYRDVPHLVSPVVTDVRRAAGCLEWAVREMQERYTMLSAVGGRDIGSYNGMAPGERCKRALAAGADSPERFAHQMPHVVIMVDELSDLMMQVPKEVEESMRRLAQKSRATGIHMVLATQRPSVDVITGTIRANFPCRIAFQVAVSVDSRVIIGQGGAERLLGKGDMLFVPPERANPIRAKGVYVAEEEIERVLDHIRKQPPADSRLALDEPPPAGDGGGGGFPSPAGIAGRRSHEPDADELYVEAVRIVLGSRRGSVSLLQRRLGIGYTRAGKLIDMMAADGLIGPYKGSKARDII
ncbi:MAG: DNA translocase FtsK, partial [Planctomycetota bacterium]